jgi:hypothetical protein
MGERLLRWGSWTGTIAPFAIWMLYFLVVYAIVSVGCIGGYARAEMAGIHAIRLALGLATVAAAAGIAAFGWIGWRRGHGQGSVGPAAERARFAGSVAVLAAFLAALCTAWVALPALMLHPCQ